LSELPSRANKNLAQGGGVQGRSKFFQPSGFGIALKVDLEGARSRGGWKNNGYGAMNLPADKPADSG
jgi:hypothetical protein